MTGLRNTYVLRAVMALPALVLALGGMISLSLWWALMILPVLALVFETLGKYPALMLSGGLWIWGFALVFAVLPGWGILPAVFLISLLVVIPVVRIGQDWGNRRYARMAARGRPMIEWEWVYVGRSFAQGHALNRFSPMLMLVAASLVVVLALSWTVWVQMAVVPRPGLWGALLVLVTVTLIGLWRRWPVAYPLVFLCLAPAFPLSLPLIFYWADGRRPNLIYRHRFERLVPMETSHV